MPKLKALYREAFPANERAPFWLLRKRAEQGLADFWCLQEQGAWVGLAYVIRNEELAYLFFFALDKACRNQGLGTQAMKELQAVYSGRCFFLALEPLDERADNYDQRLRRHDFYVRCGLQDLPFRLKEAVMIYAVMGTVQTVRPDAYRAMMRRYLGPVLRYLVDTRLIP